MSIRVKPSFAGSKRAEIRSRSVVALNAGRYSEKPAPAHLFDESDGVALTVS